MRHALLAALLTIAIADPALADRGPPEGSRPLSQIIAQIEKRGDVAYIKEVEFDDGVYKVEYRNREGKEREIKIDPRTGEERR